jgi:hypothetical protein
MIDLQCVDIANCTLGSPVKRVGGELLYHCTYPENHSNGDSDPSLKVNPSKNVFFCGPCGVGGNAWQFAAFLAKVDPENKPAVLEWLAAHRLLNDHGGRKRVAEYIYQDAEGRPIGKVVRWSPKAFHQERPDGQGGWTPGGFAHTLYRLPEVSKVKGLLVAEGEKDVNASWEKLRIPATTSGNAGSWKPEFAEFLRDRSVCVIAHKDDPGRRHARAVAESLVGIAARVWLVELPGEGVNDLFDWIEAGGTQEKLFDLIKGTPVLSPKDVAAWNANPQVVDDGKPKSRPTAWNPWAAALSAREFLTQTITEAEFLIPRLVAKGTITEVFSPRGLGKTLFAIWLAVKLALEGLRVLYLNRDNPPRVLRQYLEGWHAGEAERLKVLNREQVPPLTNPATWAMFPWSEYDLMIVDSFDATAEGVGEKDSAKPSLALAPLLDIAHREGGPAVLVLGNTVKTGEHSRGSGVVEDRADMVFEVRDVTGFVPSGKKPWWEELPPAGAGDWAARATRRQRKEKIRLAFIPTKFRAGEEPEPFAFGIDFTTDPWSLKEVTDDIDLAGAEARNTRRREREETEDRAAEALKAEIARRTLHNEPPLVKDRGKRGAVSFLHSQGLSRDRARGLLKAREGVAWVCKPIPGERGNPLGLFPPDSDPAPQGRIDENRRANHALAEAAKTAGTERSHLRGPHQQGPAQMPLHGTRITAGAEEAPICAEDSECPGSEVPLEGEL